MPEVTDGLREKLEAAVEQLRETGAVYAIEDAEIRRIADALLPVVAAELQSHGAGLVEAEAELGTTSRARDSWYRKAQELRKRAEDAEADRDRLAAEVAELRTEVTRRQEYLDKLRERAGKNYGDAKKLRRWLDEEREAVKAYCAEADAAEATVARLRSALSRALDLLGREHHYESSYTAQGIAILREAHDGSHEPCRSTRFCADNGYCHRCAPERSAQAAEQRTALDGTGEAS